MQIPFAAFFFCRVRRFLFSQKKKKMRHNAMVITM
jgi:hypothetical protein